LAEQEGDFDAETRFCVKWFSQFGWNEASSGEADILTRAVDTSVTRLERGGVFRAAAGKSRLLEPSEMPSDWDPSLDKDISVWEVALRIAYALQTDGAEKAGEWMATASTRVDMDAVKELSYMLYSICERKGWAESALLFNGLGTSWSDLTTAARAPKVTSLQQSAFDLDVEDEGE
jgi:putative DNA methylase